MNRHPQSLLTPRLILRSARPDDADALFHAYCGVPDCARYLTRGVHTAPEQTAIFLEKWCLQAWTREDDSFAWVIAERGTDVPMGTFVVVRVGDTAHIHFGIGKRYWGCGLVAEAGQRAVSWLFEHHSMRQLSTVCDAGHLRSRRVLEKLGFTSEGVIKNHLLLPAFGPLARDGVAYSRGKEPALPSDRLGA